MLMVSMTLMVMLIIITERSLKSVPSAKAVTTTKTRIKTHMGRRTIAMATIIMVTTMKIKSYHKFSSSSSSAAATARITIIRRIVMMIFMMIMEIRTLTMMTTTTK